MRVISPVYFKELRQIAGRRRSFALKTVFAVSLVGAVLLALTVPPHMGEAAGLIVFGFVVFSELTAVIIVSPVLTAGTVSGEREANTLGLLLLTRLSAWQIVQDKGLSRVTHLVYLLLLSLPCLFGAVLLGGVEVEQVVVASAAIAGTAIAGAGFGLLASASARRFVSAVAGAYALVLVALIVPPLYFAATAPGMPPVATMARCNPFVALGLCLDPFGMAAAGGLAAIGRDFLLLSVAVYAVCLVLATVLLRRNAASTIGEASGPPRRSVHAALHWLGNDLLLGLHPARLLDFRGQLGANPIVWKNAGLRHDPIKAAFHRLVVLLLVLVAGFAVWVMAAGAPAHVKEAFGYCLFAVSLTLGLLLTTLLAAASFARERQAGTFEVLLTTSLRGRDLVTGTALALLRSSAFFWLLPLAFLMVALALHRGLDTMLLPALVLVLVLVLAAVLLFAVTRAWPSAWPSLWLGTPGALAAVTCVSAIAAGLWEENADSIGLVPVVCLVLFYVLFIIAVGMLFSVMVKTTARAVVLTLLVVAGVAVGIPIVAGVLATLMSFGTGGERWSIAILSFSPSFWLGASAVGQLHEALWGHTGPGWPLLIVHLALYAAATTACLGYLSRNFDALVGRQPGGAPAPPPPAPARQPEPPAGPAAGAGPT